MPSVWTDPPTWVTDQVMTAVDINTYLNENTRWLKDGKQVGEKYRYSNSDYSSSSTSFVNVDGTNVAVTLSGTKSGRILAACSFFFAGDYNGGAGNFPAFQLACDGTGAGIGYYRGEDNAIQFATLVALFTGLAEGNHTITLQYKVDTQLVNVYTNTYPLHLIAVEL